MCITRLGKHCIINYDCRVLNKLKIIEASFCYYQIKNRVTKKINNSL